MNQEQINSLIRQALLFVGGIIAGTSFVSKFFTAEQVTAILTSDTVVKTLSGIVMAGIGSFWALLSRTNKNLVVAANNVPDVAGVILKPTDEARKISSETPSTVAIAGTKAAEKVVEGAVP